MPPFGYHCSTLVLLASPAQRGRVYGRIPVTRQFTSEPQQGNRTSGHFQGGDIASYEVARDSDVFAMQNALQGIEHDVQFDEWSSTHTIDQCQELITGLYT